jgi:hypothetical protein
VCSASASNGLALDDGMWPMIDDRWFGVWRTEKWYSVTSVLASAENRW